VDGAQVKLLAMDVQEDLALLIGPPLGRAVNFRASDQVSQGEDVLAYGFPLQSVLATSGQIGSGLVSATNGLRNNPSQLQIDVPLQSGNSGGPLLDRQGQLVGMTVSKLNALQVARVTGDIPQNVRDQTQCHQAFS
jgi:serine protease Do